MLEDRILLYRSRRGDRQEFDRLYERHLDALLTVARSLLGNAAEAEDVVQEVLVSLLESLAKFRLRGSLRGYLAVCVANRCRDLLRRRNLMGPERGEPAGPEGSPEPLELVIRSEQIRRVQAAMSELPHEQREVIVLHIHAGMTFRAMARALNLPLGTVQSRYQYGLNHLKTALNGQDEL
jgi:RNA polymerase sigma-70 factor, ECF subfamily